MLLFIVCSYSSTYLHFSHLYIIVNHFRKIQKTCGLSSYVQKLRRFRVIVKYRFILKSKKVVIPQKVVL